MERSARRSSSRSTTNSEESRENVCLSKTTGGRESRRFFNLTHLRSAAVDNDDNSEDEWLQDLEVFLKQTWNMLAVSVLYNFNSEDEVQLKQYAKKLREEVSCLLSKEDVSYDAKVQKLDMKRPKETDHPVIEIQLVATIVGRAKTTMVYRGYLISWQSEPTILPTKNSTQLPLLLCRGTQNTMRAVHATLCRMFDCIIVSLPASPEDLRWILPIVISPNGGNESSKKNDEVHLEYMIPTLPKIESITLEFLASDIINLWNSLMHDKDRIDLEEVDQFHEVLQTQMQEFSSIQIGLCLLHRINLPALTISEIKMKVMNVEAMHTILTFLNEKAMSLLHVNATLLSISK